MLERGLVARPKEPFDPYVVDWGAIAPLKLRAATLAEGLYSGAHRSLLKGSGVEFLGQRPYVRGDDLRFVDKRSLLRHDKLMIREFETETDRALWVVVDATLSMGFKGGGPASKYPFAALIAAVLARIAVRAGDPVGLLVIGGDQSTFLQAKASRDMFHRVTDALTSATAKGDWSTREDSFASLLAPLHEKARRGSVIVFLSDLVDLPPLSEARLSELATRNRRVFGVRVLSPEEATFPFREHARFTSVEGGTIVEANPETVRAAYLAELERSKQTWSDVLSRAGGSVLDVKTTDDPAKVIALLLQQIRGEVRR